MRLKYVVVIGDQLPEDVLFVETDAAKTSVFQLGKREVMERVFDVIELVFWELLAAAKGARVERIRRGRFGVHLYRARAREREREREGARESVAPLCYFSRPSARVGKRERERERERKLIPLFLLLGKKSVLLDATNFATVRVKTQLRSPEKKRYPNSPINGSRNISVSALSLHTLFCFSRTNKKCEITHHITRARG